MTDAGGTTTLTKLYDAGQVSVYRIRNTSVSTGETIPLDIAGSPFAAEDQVIILGAQNENSEEQVSGATLVVAYDETNKHFTVTESGVTDKQIDIVFMSVGQVKIDVD